MKRLQTAHLKPIISTVGSQYEPEVIEVIEFWNIQPNLRKSSLDFKTKIFKETYALIKTIFQNGYQSLRLSKDWRDKYDIENTAPLTFEKIKYGITILNEKAVTQQYAYTQKMSLKNFLYNPVNYTSLCLQILHTEGAQSPGARLLHFLIDTENNLREKLKLQASRLNREIYLKTDKEINEEVARTYNKCVNRARKAVNFSMGFHQSDPWPSAKIESETIKIIFDICNKSKMKYSWDIDYWNFETAVCAYFDFIEAIYEAETSTFNIHYLKVWGNGVWERFVISQRKNHCEVSKP